VYGGGADEASGEDGARYRVEKKREAQKDGVADLFFEKKVSVGAFAEKNQNEILKKFHFFFGWTL